MSRNLCSTNCYYCPFPSQIPAVEPLRPVRPEDTHPVYFSEYEGLIVANGECPWCHAKYLLWFRGPPRWLDVGHMHARFADDGTPIPFDSSFRSSFDDEPGPADFPTIEKVERETWIDGRSLGRVVIWDRNSLRWVRHFEAYGT
jgi:hypothetical protein